MRSVFVDARGLADRLKVSYATVLQWARRDKIPCVQSGRGRYLFNLDSVLESLAPKDEPNTPKQGGEL